MHTRLLRSQVCTLCDDVASPVRKVCQKLERNASKMLTPCRCVGEQYQAFWHRLHHREVGLQHTVQGWLMRGPEFIVEESGVKWRDFEIEGDVL